MAKEKEKKPEVKKEIEMIAFKMQTFTDDGKDGKPFHIVAPDHSLDADGDAESALAGIYRKA